MYRLYSGVGLTDSNAQVETTKTAIAAKTAVVPPFSLDYGIVICGGGPKYFPGAYVTIRMFRHLGCLLPIQLWHLGKPEMPDSYKRLLVGLNVETVDAREVQQRHPHKRLNGWEVKVYSIMHSPFRHVLFIDADNIPLVHPDHFFNSETYKKFGVLFWPDRFRLKQNNPVWNLVGIPFQDEPEFESGQIVIDKARHWSGLLLTNWFNENSEYWYSKFHGDKETFHMAWRKLEVPYFMAPPLQDKGYSFGMYQHDWNNKRVFQHGIKWNTNTGDVPADYTNVALCRDFVKAVPESFNIKMVWMPEFMCQNYDSKEHKNCPYCPYDYDHVDSRLMFMGKPAASNLKASYDDILAFFRTNADVVRKYIEISGGEPLLYPHLGKMLGTRGVSHGWTWGITSNTLHTKGIQDIISECGGRIDGCVCWTASYHPFCGKDDVFANNIKLIRSACRNNIKVTVVVAPQTLSILGKARDFLATLPLNAGIVYHVDTHGQTTIEELTKKAREILGNVHIEFGDPEVKTYKCDINRGLLCLNPDGNLFPCVSKAYMGKSPICKVDGNTALIELPGVVESCTEVCFACCDRTKRR